jgi:hypothetical protein
MLAKATQFEDSYYPCIGIAIFLAFQRVLTVTTFATRLSCQSDATSGVSLLIIDISAVRTSRPFQREDDHASR